MTERNPNDNTPADDQRPTRSDLDVIYGLARTLGSKQTMTVARLADDREPEAHQDTAGLIFPFSPVQLAHYKNLKAGAATLENYQNMGARAGLKKFEAVTTASAMDFYAAQASELFKVPVTTIEKSSMFHSAPGIFTPAPPPRAPTTDTIEGRPHLIIGARRPGPSEVRTQKARGLAVLSKMKSRIWPENFTIPDWRVWPQNSKLGKLPRFARPCPVTPRHGFVESRTVNSWDDFERIKNETLACDPGAEIILMERLTGRVSGILTPTAMTWGRGNAGATSGKSVSIPCLDADNYWVIEGLGSSNQALAGIAGDDVAYIEVVEHRGTLKGVQMRAGPRVSSVTNFIPRNVKVTQVLDAQKYGDNLIAFDAALKRCQQDGPGVVVSALGMSLSCHFAIQAILLDVSCVTSHAVTVGDLLEREEGTADPWGPDDYQFLAASIGNLLLNPSYVYDDTIVPAVGALHAHVTWPAEPHLLHLAAHGMVATALYTACAAMGEMRHWYVMDRGPGGLSRSSAVEPACTLFDYTKSDRESGAGSRSATYSLTLREDLATIHGELLKAAMDFRVSGWAGGYAGDGWSSGAVSGAALLRAATRFALDPTKSNWADAAARWNKTVNEAHNNGFILNKWVNQQLMTLPGKAPSFNFNNLGTARLVLDTDFSRLSLGERERASLGCAYYSMLEAE